MLGRGWAVTLPILLVLAIALGAGCNGNGTDAGATATQEPVAATPVDIRQVDLASEPGLAEFLGTTGGAVDEKRILFADLTGDGNEEAVVPVSSGGEGGDIAVFIFGQSGDVVQELLMAQPAESSMTAAIENGQLVTAEGVFAPGDPFGFPSQLLRRYYIWNGEALVVEREEQFPTQ